MLIVGAAAPVVAQTDEEAAERAAQEIAAARDRANQAAEDFFAAESRLQLLELEQERLVLELESLAQTVEELRLAVEFVAVNRFVSSGASGIPILTDFERADRAAARRRARHGGGRVGCHHARRLRRRSRRAR